MNEYGFRDYFVQKNLRKVPDHAFGKDLTRETTISQIKRDFATMLDQVELLTRLLEINHDESEQMRPESRKTFSISLRSFKVETLRISDHSLNDFSVLFSDDLTEKNTSPQGKQEPAQSNQVQLERSRLTFIE